MNKNIYFRAAMAAVALVVTCALDVLAQECRISYDMVNKARHVIGEVNEECPGSIHSPPWGNWGVSSNVGGVINGDQFRGFNTLEDPPQGQWNSCTEDYVRDAYDINATDPHAPYNHDHNGNGLGDDQFSNTTHKYGGAAVDVGVFSCPRDTNGDGSCDTGGCSDVSVLSTNGHFLSLYELDWDGNDFVTTLYADGATQATMSCDPLSCGGANSNWVTTNYSTDTEVTAQIRMTVLWGQFLDTNGQCADMAEWDPTYACQ